MSDNAKPSPTTETPTEALSRETQSRESLSRETVDALSRRRFIAKTIAAATTLLVPTSAVAASKTKSVDYSGLAKDFGFKGDVVARGDAKFNEYVFGELWNKLAPTRTPDVVARCLDEQDVIAAVKYAKSKKMKIAVRGGGHNWVAPSIRNSGMMLDLTPMNKVVSIDPVAKKAVMQPIISNREVFEHLAQYNLAYPTGHCPPVKLSGYLLGGGMAWNQGVWGPGIGSVEAIDMVTADGDMITASETQNSDYYWAARGASYGLFAVAVRYHLKLYDLPKAITASVYYYPYDKLVEVAEWLGPLASKVPPSVELSLFAITAPRDLADKCAAHGGKVAMVTATMFADSRDEAVSTLKMFDTCPVLATCLKKSIAQPTTMKDLFDASGSLWPGDLRCKVDAMYSNAPLADLYRSVKDHFESHKTATTVFLFTVFTGPDLPAKLPDVAFSQSAKLYGGPWTMWTDAEDDKYNIAWHEQCVNKLLPNVVGHYVSESNTIGRPEFLKNSYTPEKFARLAQLRKKYDPDGRFFSYTDGLS